MLMKNGEIYSLSKNLMEAFKDGTQKLPIKINFYIQKNKNNLINLAQDIETARMDILKSHAVVDSVSGELSLPPEAIEAANVELAELYELEQDVNIYMVKIDVLPDDMVLTTGQMEALMFMLQ